MTRAGWLTNSRRNASPRNISESNLANKLEPRSKNVSDTRASKAPASSSTILLPVSLRACSWPNPSKALVGMLDNRFPERSSVPSTTVVIVAKVPISTFVMPRPLRSRSPELLSWQLVNTNSSLTSAQRHDPHAWYARAHTHTCAHARNKAGMKKAREWKMSNYTNVLAGC